MPLKSLRAAVLRLAGKAAPARPAPPSTRKRRRKAARPRDFQRARVYRWEAVHVMPHAADRLSLDGCRALVEAVFLWAEQPATTRQGWSPPLVTDGRGRRHACGSREVIKLPRWARTRAVVLHECAHGLARDMHGPEFVAVYLVLLERFAGLEAARLRETLAASKVSLAPSPGRDFPATEPPYRGAAPA